MKKILSHVPYYVPLFSIFLVALIGFISFPHDRQFQSNIVASVAVSYVVWGILYHFLHHNLTLTIIFEYIVISVIGLASILTLLSWG